MRNLTELREAAVAVAEVGRTSVSVVRDSFASGDSPFTTAGSGSVANYLDTFVDNPLGAKLIRGTSRYGLLTAPGGTAAPPPRIELDSVAVVEDRNRGILDQFTTRLTLSIRSLDAARVERVRIFRADIGKARVPRAGFAAMMDAPPAAGKGADNTLPQAQRAADLGVGNVLAQFVADDPVSPRRVVISPAERELSAPMSPLNTNRTTQTSAGLLSIAGLDRSVLENLTFYLNRRSVQGVAPPERGPLIPGRTSGLNVLRGSGISAAGNIVQASNEMEFVSIGTVTPRGAGARTVGSVIEMSFVDPSVVYGARYAYYAAVIGPNGELGPRSRIVHVTVTRTVPPQAPRITYGLTGGVPRFSIRCMPGTSHVEVYRSGRAALNSVVLGSDQSLVIEGPANRVGEFYHAGDLGLGSDGSTTFVDRDVVPGDRPTYRFYAVDAYGLKCQTPFSCDMRIPDHGEPLPLAIPSITTEQVSLGKPAVRVRVSVDDDRIVGFVFSRRDVTVNERAVHQANQPELVTLGRTDPKRAISRRGPTPLDLQWPSVMMATAGSASFTDTSVRIDRVYQYAVQAIDRRGNKTFLVGAQPIGVYSKPTVDPPSDLMARTTAEGDRATGVLLTWTPGTVDFSPNQLLDDQDVLTATSVRSVFQVERRKKGSPYWDAMPATTESYFFDQALSEVPNFRPAYVVPGLDYEYRVQAMQSGGFVSPRTDIVSVFVAPPPMAPEVVWVRATDVAVRPLNVVVSWDMSTAFIEEWEVQRASTNKIFGSRISSMDSTLARSLDYRTVARVTPEASRAAGMQADVAFVRDPNVYVGRRFYLDADLDPANSYFYRVRSISRGGSASGWTYGGISVSDHAFDRKLLSILSDDEKVALATDQSPIIARFTEATTADRLSDGELRPRTVMNKTSRFEP